MPKKPLTDAFVKSALPDGQRVEYGDTKVPGLVLRITPAGAKSWAIRYRIKDGTQKRHTIGKYPGIPLSVARDEAHTALRCIASGGDPAAEKRQEKDAAHSTRMDTVQKVGERYFLEAAAGRHRPNGSPKRSVTLQNERAYFDAARETRQGEANALFSWTIAKRLGKRKLADLKRAEIQAFINSVADEVSPSAALHSRNVLQRIFAFAVWQEIVDANPCQYVSVPKFESRERVLTDAELRSLWKVITVAPDDLPAGVSKSCALAIQLAGVTLQRRAEVVEMRVDELDLPNRTWTIPRARTKNKQTHIVPLSDLAVEIINEALSLRRRESAFLFPAAMYRKTATRKGDDVPIHPAMVTAAFRKVCHSAGEVVDATAHDLRRTGATNLTSERLGFPRFIVSRVLNHAGDTGGTAAVTAVYDRNAYMSEKRRALDAWASLLSSIVQERPMPSNVITLQSA